MFFRAIIRKWAVVSRCSFSTLFRSRRAAGGTQFHSESLTGTLYQTLWSIVTKARAKAREPARGWTFDLGGASPNGTETKEDRQYRKFYPSNIDRNDRRVEGGFGSDLSSLPSLPLFGIPFLPADSPRSWYSVWRKITKEGDLGGMESGKLEKLFVSSKQRLLAPHQPTLNRTPCTPVHVARLGGRQAQFHAGSARLVKED